MSLGGCVTEDKGTVVSLDRNSSPSNCQCASLATCEQGQRSPLTLGKKGSTVVSLDRCSSGGSGSDTLVSLDRAGCSNIGSEHCVRSAYHNSQRTLASHLEDLVCSHTHGCAASIHSGNSCTPSVSNFSCSSSFHARHDNPNPAQQTVHLNLDSQIEDTPVIKPNFRSHSPRTITREERHILNGSSYSSPLPLQSFSHLHSQTPSSPKAGLPQQLQNIVERGENECFHSSDNVKFRDRAIAAHCDEHKLHVANSLDLLTRHSSLVKTASDSEEDDENQVDRSATRARDKRRVGKRVREHQSRLKEGASGSSRVVATPSSGNGDVKVISKRERVTADDENDECQRKVVHGSEASAVSLQDGSPHIHVYESSTSPPQQSSPSSPQCDPLRSAPLDKACSPSRSDSPLSDTDPLGSTASGYAATEESSSTCNVEINSKGDYSTHEFDDIHKALLDVRSQFSYPMQRLLGQVESEGQDENLGLGSNFHPLLSHSHAAQSHSGSDSDQFQTHSVPLNTYGIRVHSMQQIQSVDV